MNKIVEEKAKEFSEKYVSKHYNGNDNVYNKMTTIISKQACMNMYEWSKKEFIQEMKILLINKGMVRNDKECEEFISEFKEKVMEEIENKKQIIVTSNTPQEVYDKAMEIAEKNLKEYQIYSPFECTVNACKDMYEWTKKKYESKIIELQKELERKNS